MKSKVRRDPLLQTLNLAKPALSAASFVPILSHFCLDGAYVYAYNDVMAVAARFPLDDDFCVPGDLFIKVLGSVLDEELMLDTTDAVLTVAGKRSRIKLPTLPSKDFTFNYKVDHELGETWPLTADFVDGLSKCLISVGADPTHPAQLGVTVIGEGGIVNLFSTDNFTISQYRVEEMNIGDAQFILPTAFCEQVVALAKAFPNESAELAYLGDAAVARFGEEVWVFTKLVADVSPMQFGSILSRHLPQLWRMVDIPPEFDGAVDRALLVLSSEADKITEITATGANLRIFSTSPLGESTDEMSISGDIADAVYDGAFLVDPDMVKRAGKVSTQFALLPKVMVMGGDNFIHLISHCARGGQ